MRAGAYFLTTRPSERAPGRMERLRQAIDGQRYRLVSGTRAQGRDPTKDWDVDNIVRLLANIDRNTPILDCGAFYSPAVAALLRRGFRDVSGIDLNPRLPLSPYHRRASFTVQNLHHTAFDDGSFGVVLCSSTIEHGCSWAGFAGEARRLLRPGGLLYISTDLVRTRPEGGEMVAFGAPWLPLVPDDLEEHAAIIRRAGFSLPEVTAPPLDGPLPFQFLGHELGFVAFAAVAT